MESACTVECYPKMRLGFRNELILEWAWLQHGKKNVFAVVLQYKDGCAEVDMIDRSINNAKVNIKWPRGIT